ncbi:MAG: hypothetical protein WD800_06905 [Dehalococcoidia bacterium]
MTTMVICPQCGRPAEIAPGEHPFCAHCDYPLFWVAPRPQPDAPVMAELEPVSGPVCIVCDAQNEEGRALCRRCGQPLARVMVRRRRTWETVAPPVAGPRRGRRILAVLLVLLVLAALVAAVAWLFWPRSAWEVVVLDQGESSWDVSATLRRGAPVISYVDAGDFTVRVVSCGHPRCDGAISPNLHTVVASVGERGQGHGTAITMGADGHPVIAFRDGTRRALNVAHCGDPQCSDGGAITITEVDPGPDTDDPRIDVGSDPSIALGADGLPIVAYHDSTRGALKIAHCDNRECTSASIAILDRGAGQGGAGGVGFDTSIQIGRDGLPIVAFRDADAQALRFARCSDERCTQAVIVTMVATPGADPGHEASLALAADGTPIVAYADWSDDGIYVATCSGITCEEVTTRRVDRAEDGTSADATIALDAAGLPVVAYRQKEPGDERASRILKIVRCHDIRCERSSTPEVVDSVGRTGYTPRILVLADGTLAIAHGDATQGALEFSFLD